jgi:hypothetical protein
MGVWDGVDANATDKYLSGFPQKKYLSGLTGRTAEQEEARQVPSHQGGCVAVVSRVTTRLDLSMTRRPSFLCSRSPNWRSCTDRTALPGRSVASSCSTQYRSHSPPRVSGQNGGSPTQSGYLYPRNVNINLHFEFNCSIV